MGQSYPVCSVVSVFIMLHSFLSSILLLISIISVKLFLVQALFSIAFFILNINGVSPPPYVNITDV